MVKVIGFVGKMQAGKTTASNYIMSKQTGPAVKTSFANLLKEMILKAGLCTTEELWGEKTDFSRLMLQKIGTEIIRKQVNENFWVNKMVEEISTWTNYNPKGITIIIDDVRFLNEAEMVKWFHGKLIRISRPLNRSSDKDRHASEVEQDKIVVDYEISNDGTLEELKQKVDKIIQEI